MKKLFSLFSALCLTIALVGCGEKPATTPAADAPTTEGTTEHADAPAAEGTTPPAAEGAAAPTAEPPAAE